MKSTVEVVPTYVTVYIFNQSTASVSMAINGGATFTVAGTSLSAKWASTAVTQTFQSSGATPGNLNVGSNTVSLLFPNGVTQPYTFTISQTSPASLEIYIFFDNTTLVTGGLIVTASGVPANSSGSLQVVSTTA